MSRSSIASLAGKSPDHVPQPDLDYAAWLGRHRSRKLGQMSAHRGVFRVDADSADERLEQAAAMLSTGTGVVLFDGTIALRRTSGYLLCEVLDAAPTSRRCEIELEVLLENARRALDASGLGQRLPRLPCRWIVVEDVAPASRSRDMGGDGPPMKGVEAGPCGESLPWTLRKLTTPVGGRRAGSS